MTLDEFKHLAYEQAEVMRGYEIYPTMLADIDRAIRTNTLIDTIPLIKTFIHGTNLHIWDKHSPFLDLLYILCLIPILGNDNTSQELMVYTYSDDGLRTALETLSRYKHLTRLSDVLESAVSDCEGLGIAVMDALETYVVAYKLILQLRTQAVAEALVMNKVTIGW